MSYQSQMQAYQNNQTQQILNAAKAFGDYIDAVRQVDDNHQFELFLACLAVFGAKMGWQLTYKFIEKPTKNFVNKF